MSGIYFDKTDKGRDEISSRKYQLASKLRPLLVMIDGKHSSDELLQRLAAIGLDQSHLKDLLNAGFIAEVAKVESSPPALARTAITSKNSSSNNDAQVSEIPPTVVASGSTTKPGSKAEALQALRQFFNDGIKANLGLRGFTMQLRVERADSLLDFMALGDDFIESLHKSKGQQVARSLEARMQELIVHAQQFES